MGLLLLFYHGTECMLLDCIVTLQERRARPVSETHPARNAFHPRLVFHKFGHGVHPELLNMPSCGTYGKRKVKLYRESQEGKLVYEGNLLRLPQFGPPLVHHNLPGDPLAAVPLPLCLRDAPELLCHGLEAAAFSPQLEKALQQWPIILGKALEGVGCLLHVTKADCLPASNLSLGSRIWGHDTQRCEIMRGGRQSSMP